MHRVVRRGAILAALSPLFSASAALACSACGCTLTTDWIGEGLAATPGLRAELRYDYIPQSQLRTGTRNIRAVALPADREIERYTYNHYVTAGLDWSGSQAFAVNVQLPLVFRPHATIAEGDTDLSNSHTDGIGDVRVTVRYQGFGGPGISGVQFGLKLPTGGFHNTFQSGPQAGEPIDRGLQAGTGTTDAILGAYHFGALADRIDWFVQASTQIPFNNRDNYKPGITGVGSIGAHYNGWKGITPQLQLNLRVAGQDYGLNSDHDNSGGELVYLSPGATVRLNRGISLYGFVQAPIYQRVIGYQLEPKITVSAGLQVRL